MEEINIQEWDGLQPDPISDKTKIELALIDLYNRLAMQIPANHQTILDELAEKLLPQEASLTVRFLRVFNKRHKTKGRQSLQLSTRDEVKRGHHQEKRARLHVQLDTREEWKISLTIRALRVTNHGATPLW